MWIDACPTDSNLLAAGGFGMNISVYDKRNSKVVEVIKGVHTGI